MRYKYSISQKHSFFFGNPNKLILCFQEKKTHYTQNSIAGVLRALKSKSQSFKTFRKFFMTFVVA